MPVTIGFHDHRGDHSLGELENVDADTLAEDLQAAPSSVEAHEVASQIHTALRTGEAVIIDRAHLEAVHRACTESLAVQQVPNLKEFCAIVDRVVSGLPPR